MRARLLLVLAYLLFALSAGALLPQLAAAEASRGPDEVAGTPGLPDGRVYEMVSPANKPGSEAGSPIAGTPPYIVAGPEGDEVAYSNSGPVGETSTGLDFFTIAKRSDTGWASRGAVPRGIGTQAVFLTNPDHGLSFASTLGSVVFGANDVFVPEQEQGSPTPHLYRYSESGQVQWLGEPTVSEPFLVTKFPGANLGTFAGGSQDFTTVYFSFPGLLTPEGEEPNPALGDISYADEVRTMNGSGALYTYDMALYEWHEGRLSAAGILPNGHMDPFGAIPASSVDGPNVQEIGNQVSEDGSKLFFLSPDPKSGSGRPSELYVRMTAPDGTQKTLLVSRDELLADVGGYPTGAPGGVQGGAHFYASPDGSHAFFQSAEQLTSDAPSNGDAKEYEFDTETGALSYLPGVADDPAENPAEILASARDGSNFIFVREGELELWDQGAITKIAPVPSSPTPLRATPDGKVYVFQSSAAFPALGFNDGNGADSQIYRYEAAGNVLSCISCAPAGGPVGSASLSHAFGSGNVGNTLAGISPGNRGISEDGRRVFFDTTAALVSQDTNGVRDVYEWEEGELHLISTGVSASESFFGDTSASGNDVFFSTNEGLVRGDVDEGYDLYDARVPRPGDRSVASAVPCEGAVCQGPPSTPQLLAPPASEAFNGAGNLSVAVRGAGSSQPRLVRKQKLVKALKACAKRKRARNRARCRRSARRRYGGPTARRRTRRQGAEARHGVGRHHRGNSRQQGRGQ